MTWRVAKSLDVLLAELKAAFPVRDKDSDGAIGNQEHAARDSDHNPNAAGVVRARDYDEDLDGKGNPAGESKMARVAEHLRGLGADGDTRLNAVGRNGYIIYERRIAGAGKGWKWRPYSGPNAHDHHMHVSVCSDPGGYDRTGTWGIAALFAPPKPAELPQEIFDMDFYIVRHSTDPGRWLFFPDIAAGVKAILPDVDAVDLARKAKGFQGELKLAKETVDGIASLGA